MLVESLLHHSPIERFFVISQENRGDSVTDEVGNRTGFGHEPVDAQQQS
jgi:hypothetical protein